MGLAGSSTDADDSDDGDAPQLPVNPTGSAQSQDWLMNDTEANGNHPKASGVEPTVPESRHAGTQQTLSVLAHDVANVSDGDDEEVIACTQQPPARESAMGQWIRVELGSPPARPTGVVNVQPECSETPRIDSSAAPDDYDSDVIPCSQQPPLSPVRRPGHPAIPASCIREAPRSVNIDSDVQDRGRNTEDADAGAQRTSAADAPGLAGSSGSTLEECTASQNGSRFHAEGDDSQSSESLFSTPHDAAPLTDITTTTFNAAMKTYVSDSDEDSDDTNPRIDDIESLASSIDMFDENSDSDSDCPMSRVVDDNDDEGARNGNSSIHLNFRAIRRTHSVNETKTCSVVLKKRRYVSKTKSVPFGYIAGSGNEHG
ncbi:hypothetical protein QAD02_008132 [Eretmocerus hayati]|uniref:Uncharacterized protein n=1 Tax=Eretmocerus hayati TaxID=131215 RepID=A0ACC2N5L1_9HYME|nr:hypothetical protein QAD02_008132 [Eretmocerus hayati]